MKHLACFFKSPEGIDEHDFSKQFQMLEAHLALKPTRREPHGS
jgi:myo-inositol-1-phosphate synthase